MARDGKKVQPDAKPKVCWARRSAVVVETPAISDRSLQTAPHHGLRWQNVSSAATSASSATTYRPRPKRAFALSNRLPKAPCAGHDRPRRNPGWRSRAVSSRCMISPGTKLVDSKKRHGAWSAPGAIMLGTRSDRPPYRAGCARSPAPATAGPFWHVEAKTGLKADRRAARAAIRRPGLP